MQQSTTSLKTKLEYTKSNRKYSPEVDMNRLMQQKKLKLNNEVMVAQQQMQNLYKRQTINPSVINQEAVSAQSVGTRNNSANTKMSQTTTKKDPSTYTSEYNPIGNTKNSKLGQKKRGSDYSSSNRASSPGDKSFLKNLQKPKELQKSHFLATAKPSTSSVKT